MGVMIDPRNGDGTYPVLPLFVIPNFGYRDSGPVEQQGPFLPAVDIGVVQSFTTSPPSFLRCRWVDVCELCSSRLTQKSSGFHAISLQFQCASPRHTLIIYLANHGGARL